MFRECLEGYQRNVDSGYLYSTGGKTQGPRAESGPPPCFIWLRALFYPAWHLVFTQRQRQAPYP